MKPKKQILFSYNSHTKSYVGYEKTWHRQGKFWVPRTRILGHYSAPNLRSRIRKKRQ